MSSAQAARLLGVTVKTMQRWDREGQNAASNLEQYLPQAMREVTSVSAQADMNGLVKPFRAETRP